MKKGANLILTPRICIVYIAIYLTIEEIAGHWSLIVYICYNVTVSGLLRVHSEMLILYQRRELEIHYSNSKLKKSKDDQISTNSEPSVSIFQLVPQQISQRTMIYIQLLSDISIYIDPMVYHRLHSYTAYAARH